MKFKHNKKRNTAFIYEALIVEFSKASIAEDNSRKNKLLNIIKEYFSKGRELKKELNIYRSFEGLSSLNKEAVIRIIQEAKEQFKLLDREKIYDHQSNLISEINKNFGMSVWDNFVSSYKTLATVNQVLSKTLTPKKQVMVENKLIDALAQKEAEVKPFPNVNNLAVKTFIEKFNKEYDQTLNEEQKKLLEKFITSYEDDDLGFKIYLYEEIDRLKNIIGEKINTSNVVLSEKLQKIINRISDYNTRNLDRSMIVEVMKVQSLVREINQ